MLNESGLSSMSFELPAFEELKNIKDLSLSKISFQETKNTFLDNSKEIYEKELESLERNFETFQYSSKFLNQLSILNELTGNIQKAEELLLNAIQIDESPYFKNRLAEIYMSQSRFKDFNNIYQLPNIKKNIKTYIIQALALIKNNQLEKAELHIKEALAVDYFDFETQYLAGSIELLKGNYSKAIRSFKIAIEEATGKNAPSSLYVNMGIAYLLQNNIKKALDCLKISTALNPLNKNSVLIYSNLLIESKKYPEAIAILRTYLTYEEKECTIWDLIAKAYYLSKDYKKALESLKHQASLEGNTAIWNNIAIVYNKLKEYKKANQYFALGLKQELEKEQVPVILLENYLRFLANHKLLKELSALLKLLKPLINENSKKIIPNYYVFLLTYIEAVSAIGDNYNTIEITEKVIDTEEIDIITKMRLVTHLTYHYTMINPNIGKALAFSKIAEKNIESIEMDKTFKLLLYNNIIYTYLESNQIMEAENLINKLNPGINKIAIPTATLGLYHIKKGRIDRGNQYYENAINLVPGSVDKSRLKQKLYFELAKYYRSTEQNDKAKDYFKKVIKITTGYNSMQKLSQIMLSEIQIIK